MIHLGIGSVMFLCEHWARVLCALTLGYSVIYIAAVAPLFLLKQWDLPSRVYRELEYSDAHLLHADFSIGNKD